MGLHENFEWDEVKAQRNFKKHGVSFDDAALVLSDEQAEFYHVEEFDAVTEAARIDTSPQRLIRMTATSCWRSPGRTVQPRLPRLRESSARVSQRPPRGGGMSKKSVSRTVRKSAAEVPGATRADLDRLRAAMQRKVDMSEIPERTRFHRLTRDR